MEFVEYEVDGGVAVITLNRPAKANAQHLSLLEELNACWEQATADDAVRVVLLRANGPHFSAGHDLTSGGARGAKALTEPFDLAAMYTAEAKHYFGYSLAWRNCPKPSIAAVQGKCVAAGMMLCWPCDLILAADNAEFSDPTARMGLAGVEYMAHSWELGPRKAKEMLFRSTPISAQEAADIGMVNKVVPLASLRTEAAIWAADIATLDPMMTMIVKRGINSQLDTMGFTASLQHSFDLHELAHGIQAVARQASGDAARPSMLEHMRKTNRALSEGKAASA
jgi:enoyl-CoA hydratase